MTICAFGMMDACLKKNARTISRHNQRQSECVTSMDDRHVLLFLQIRSDSLEIMAIVC